jgi:hypothetical protein
LEEGVAGKIFGSKRDEVTGGWRELRNEEMKQDTLQKYYYV